MPQVNHPSYPRAVTTCIFAGHRRRDPYPADRKAAEEVIARQPQVVAGARANRAFLARVVRYRADECGIRRFLDIGTGCPPQATLTR